MSGLCGPPKPTGNPNLTMGGGGVGTVTEVDTGTGLTGGPITTSGTVSMSNSTLNSLAGYDNSGHFVDVTVGNNLTLSGNVLSASVSGGGGSGTVTSVGTGTGLTGGPITTIGTVSIANSVPNTLAGYNNSGVFVDVTVGSHLSLSGNILSATGIGTVTSVATGTGLTGGTITGSGTISMATSTDNSLAGYDSSGNFVDVVVGNNLTLSGNVLSSVGVSGSVIPNVSQYLSPAIITVPTYTTWYYHSNATYSTNARGAYVLTTYSSANPEILGTTALSGNYDIIGCFAMNPPFVSGKLNAYGIAIWNSGGTKEVTIEVNMTTTYTIAVKHYPTTVGAPTNAISLTYDSFPTPLWLRINCTGTTYTFYVSVDGQSWDQVYTESATAYLTTAADSGGFAIYSSNTSAATAAHLVVVHFVA